MTALPLLVPSAPPSPSWAGVPVVGLRAVGSLAPLAALSPREREVLLLLADGLSIREIAGRLYVSEATVKSHVARVLAALGVRDRIQVVVVAFRTGPSRHRGPSVAAAPEPATTPVRDPLPARSSRV